MATQPLPSQSWGGEGAVRRLHDLCHARVPGREEPNMPFTFLKYTHKDTATERLGRL